MSECVARIERLTNGFEVEVCDPELLAQNRDAKKPYRNPWKSYAFTGEDEVIAFLKKVLPSLKPADDDMATSFSRALKEDEE